jgi:hypothetical protein
MRYLPAVLAALALGGCAEEPAIETVRTTTAYQHVPSGMVFPTDVGPFARTNVYPGRAGSDGVVIGYAHMAPSGPMLITVTVERGAPPTQEAAVIDPACRAAFDARKTDIEKSNSAVKWLESRDTSVTLEGRSRPAQVAAFDYDFRGTPVRGFLVVACRVDGDWTLQYRATMPRDPDAGQTLASFMAVLPARAPTGQGAEADQGAGK